MSLVKEIAEKQRAMNKARGTIMSEIIKLQERRIKSVDMYTRLFALMEDKRTVRKLSLAINTVATFYSGYVSQL